MVVRARGSHEAPHFFSLFSHSKLLYWICDPSLSVTSLYDARWENVYVVLLMDDTNVELKRYVDDSIASCRDLCRRRQGSGSHLPAVIPYPPQLHKSVTTDKEVDSCQAIINRDNYEGVANPDDSCRSKSDVLRYTELLRWSAEVLQTCRHKSPLHHWGPEEHCLRTRRMVHKLLELRRCCCCCWGRHGVGCYK